MIRRSIRCLLPPVPTSRFRGPRRSSGYGGERGDLSTERGEDTEGGGSSKLKAQKSRIRRVFGGAKLQRPKQENRARSDLNQRSQPLPGTWSLALGALGTWRVPGVIDVLGTNGRPAPCSLRSCYPNARGFPVTFRRKRFGTVLKGPARCGRPLTKTYKNIPICHESYHQPSRRHH